MKLNGDFNQFEKAAAIVTPNISAFHHPGGSDMPMPAREEFDEALRHAQDSYDSVLNCLLEEAGP